MEKALHVSESNWAPPRLSEQAEVIKPPLESKTGLGLAPFCYKILSLITNATKTAGGSSSF